MATKKVFLPLKYVLSILWWLALLLGIIVVISFVSAHFKGEVPHIGKYSVMHIISGSMEPQIEKDTYILIKRVPAEEVKKDDIICFYSDDPTIYGCPNTHRVVEEPYMQDGELLFTTKGDHNPIPDKEPARGERLIGVWVKNLDGFTVFLNFIIDNFMWILAALLALCTASTVVSSVVKAKRAKKTEHE
jgi:signal peptidase I